MLQPLNYIPGNLRYTGVIGTGGIGSGKFFRLNNNHTLGREESRSGSFMDVNDYCKQHIILHYIKVLMGGRFNVTPIGKLGDDDTGKILYRQLQDTGFNMAHIEKLPNADTLFSFCFYYPDGSGGNLTTDNSASAFVVAADIDKALQEIQQLGSMGIIMAAPEVPLDARFHLIKCGKDNGLFCNASFTAEEMPEALSCGIMGSVDLMAINVNEASAIAGVANDASVAAIEIVKKSIERLMVDNTGIYVSVTDGANGSWCWDGETLNNIAAVPVNVVSTAGAGDAFFAGILCGIAAGLHLFEAQQLATILAAGSVTSPHSIHPRASRLLLKKLLPLAEINFSNDVLKLLED